MHTKGSQINKPLHSVHTNTCLAWLKCQLAAQRQSSARAYARIASGAGLSISLCQFGSCIHPKRSTHSHTLRSQLNVLLYPNVALSKKDHTEQRKSLFNSQTVVSFWSICKERQGKRLFFCNCIFCVFALYFFIICFFSPAHAIVPIVWLLF